MGYGIQNQSGHWYQQDASIANLLDVFGRLLGAHVFNTESQARRVKMAFERQGFTGLQIKECDPLSAIEPDNDFTGLIQDD